jgi:hypothetical protein
MPANIRDMSQTHLQRPPAAHKDSSGQTRAGPDWETLTERLIPEGQEAGAFDNLPTHGEPLRREHDAPAGELALAYRVLLNAGSAPPWIEVDKDMRRLAEAIAGVLGRASTGSILAQERQRRRLEELLDEHTSAERHLAATAPTSQQQRASSDRAAKLRSFAQQHPMGR